MSFKLRLAFFGIMTLNSLMAYAQEANVAATQYHPQATTTTNTPVESTTDQTTTTTAATTTPTVKRGYKDQPCPKFSWGGPYIGLFGGGVWGDSDLNTNAGKLTATSYFATTADIGSVNQSGTGTISPNALMGGIQVGNNAQAGYLIYGAVVDYSSFRLSGSKSVTNVTYPTMAGQYSLKAYMSTSWLATLRGRLGLVFSETSPSPLIFVTGGVGVTNLHVYNSFNDTTASFGVGGATNTKSKIGWVVGAGIEYPISVNWTVDGQYQYVNFGSNSANGFVTCRAGACAGTRSPFSTAANLSASIVRLGLNYKL